MDPAKRLCLKNLPPDITKADIADIIKKRTRAQPRYIDLGVRDDGTPRRFAFVSVEGLKTVMEAINGVTLRGFNIIAEQAKPHYSFALAEAKRKREREEETEAEERQQRAELLLAKWAAQPETITKEKPPRPFYGAKQKYGRIASEIAAKSREEAKLRKSQMAGRFGGEAGAPRRFGATPVTGGAAVSALQSSSSAIEGNSQPVGGAAPTRASFRGKKAAKPVEPATPPPPPEPPQPTKEERKLTGLQAKLAALREKMKASAAPAAAA
jgi:hypothetical protein